MWSDASIGSNPEMSYKGITDAFFRTLNILLIIVCSNFDSSSNASSFTTSAFKPVSSVGLIYVFQIDLFSDRLIGNFVVNLHISTILVLSFEIF